MVYFIFVERNCKKNIEIVKGVHQKRNETFIIPIFNSLLEIAKNRKNYEIFKISSIEVVMMMMMISHQS